MSEATPATSAAPPVNPIQTELAKIRAAAADAVLGTESSPDRGDYWVLIRPRAIQAVLLRLRDDPATDYKLLTDLTCVDRPYEEKRFTIVYNLYSVTRNTRILLKVQVAEHESVPTASIAFASANWAEREVFDLFGVRFDGHPDLRRIELPDEWEGHPLRKDYPIVGRRPVILLNDVKDAL